MKEIYDLKFIPIFICRLDSLYNECCIKASVYWTVLILYCGGVEWCGVRCNDQIFVDSQQCRAEQCWDLEQPVVSPSLVPACCYGPVQTSPLLSSLTSRAPAGWPGQTSEHRVPEPTTPPPPPPPPPPPTSPVTQHLHGGRCCCCTFRPPDLCQVPTVQTAACSSTETSR